jgi:hypothetical protein
VLAADRDAQDLADHLSASTWSSSMSLAICRCRSAAGRVLQFKA